jgi:hypothetical protein
MSLSTQQRTHYSSPASLTIRSSSTPQLTCVLMPCASSVSMASDEEQKPKENVNRRLFGSFTVVAAAD